MTMSAAPAETISGTKRMLITVCVMIATLLQTLDTTNATMALPYMRSSLSAGPDQITWVLSSYVVMAAIMTAPVGWIAKRFGRRRFFIFTMAGFTLCSMACGLATSLTQIVIFRMLQGAFGAALIPLSQSTLLDIYPTEQRGAALSIWGIGVMVGPVIGPSIGGYITEAYHWRWIFYLNVPVGIVAITGLWLLLDRDRPDTTTRFDWVGFGVLGIAIGSLQLMLDRGQQLDWFNSEEIVAELVIACLGIYLFTVHLLTSKRPLVSPRLFLDRNFMSSFVMLFLMGIVLLSSTVLTALYLQNMMGYPVLDAGMMMAPRGIGTMIGMLIVGRISNQVDLRLLVLAGVALISSTLWVMSTWTPDIDPVSFALTTVPQGVGLGLVFVPLNVLAFTTLPAELRTEASAFLNLVRYTGQAIGVSLATVILVQGTQMMHARIAEHITPFNRMLLSGGAYFRWSPTRPRGIASLNAEVTHQAAISAYSSDFLFMMVVTLAMAIFLLFVRLPSRRQQ